MINRLLDLNNETELLEAVGWDESEIERLTVFLNSIFEEDKPQNFENILVKIEKEFGKNVADLLSQLFKQITFMNNMHISSIEEN